MNREDIPWVNLIWERYYQNGKLLGSSIRGSFWWRDITKLLDTFKGMVVVNISDGRTCFLWQDLWNGIIP
jgi:hypothetical protein